MTPSRLTEFAIYLTHRPGELAGVLEAAAAGGIDLAAVHVSEHADKGCVRLLGEPEEGLRHVMESLVESGVGPVVETPVLSIPVDQRPGAVRDIAVLMADQRINIRRVYMVPGATGRPAQCVFHFDDAEEAFAAIEAMDWPESAA